MGGCCIADLPVCVDLPCLDLPCFLDFGSGGCGYHPGPSKTEAHAKKIANELTKMKEKSGEYAEKSENQLLEYLEKDMNALLRFIEDVNEREYGGVRLNINIDGIRRKKEELGKNVKGHIGGILNERLVLTDPELSVILKEDDDKKRNKNFDEFVENLQHEAEKSLRSQIESTVKMQEDMVEREIRIRLEEVEKRMNEVTVAFTEIAEEKENHNTGEKKLDYMYRYEINNIMMDEIES